jgi:hypothetical protein
LDCVTFSLLSAVSRYTRRSDLDGNWPPSARSPTAVTGCGARTTAATASHIVVRPSGAQTGHFPCAIASGTASVTPRHGLLCLHDGLDHPCPRQHRSSLHYLQHCSWRHLLPNSLPKSAACWLIPSFLNQHQNHNLGPLEVGIVRCLSVCLSVSACLY